MDGFRGLPIWLLGEFASFEVKYFQLFSFFSQLFLSLVFSDCLTQVMVMILGVFYVLLCPFLFVFESWRWNVSAFFISSSGVRPHEDADLSYFKRDPERNTTCCFYNRASQNRYSFYVSHQWLDLFNILETDGQVLFDPSVSACVHHVQLCDF